MPGRCGDARPVVTRVLTPSLFLTAGSPVKPLKFASLGDPIYFQEQTLLELITPLRTEVMPASAPAAVRCDCQAAVTDGRSDLDCTRSSCGATARRYPITTTEDCYARQRRGGGDEPKVS
jgi:hypothetical protein